MAGEDKPKRVRPRPNAVMVDMDDDLRAMLEMIKDERAKETDESATLASTIRHLIRTEFVRRKLRLKPGKK